MPISKTDELQFTYTLYIYAKVQLPSPILGVTLLDTRQEEKVRLEKENFHSPLEFLI
jgi:hypothetical protein